MNDPNPHHYCGAAAREIDRAHALISIVGLNRQQKRTCGSYTACCDGWLQIEVRGLAQVREDWFASGPLASQAEISERIARGEKPWAG